MPKPTEQQRDIIYASLGLERKDFLEKLEEDFRYFRLDRALYRRPVDRLVDGKEKEPPIAPQMDRLVKSMSKPEYRAKYSNQVPLTVAHALHNEKVIFDLSTSWDELKDIRLQDLKLLDVRKIDCWFGRPQAAHVLILRLVERETDGFTSNLPDPAAEFTRPRWNDMQPGQQKAAMEALAKADSDPALMDKLLYVMDRHQERTAAKPVPQKAPLKPPARPKTGP